MATLIVVALGLSGCVTLAFHPDNSRHSAGEDGAPATGSIAANGSCGPDVEHRASLLLQQLYVPTPSVNEESRGTGKIQFGGCELLLARDCRVREGDVRELVSSWEALQQGFQGCCGSGSSGLCHSKCCGEVLLELHSGSNAGAHGFANKAKVSSANSMLTTDVPHWCGNWAELSNIHHQLLLRAVVPQHADPVVLSEQQQPADGLGAVELDRAASGKAKIKAAPARGVETTTSRKGEQDAHVSKNNKPGKPAGDQDLLTVMTYNTNLLRIEIGLPISSEPNLNTRARHLVRWMETLKLSEVPDVLVLEDIYSSEGELLVRQLCNTDWVRNENVNPWSKVPTKMDCNRRSHFKVTTSDLNVVTYLWPAMGGGVVVLLKKGLQLVSATPQRFRHCSGIECFVRYGFWAIELAKGSEKYWLFATSAVSHETETHQKIRQSNFKEIREYINAHVPDGEKIVIAGGLNIFTGPYEDAIGRIHPASEVAEQENTFKTLGAVGAPVSPGELWSKGFWLPLNYSLTVTMDPANNHFVRSVPSQVQQGPQQFDWVLAPGRGDRLATPFRLRYQVVPIKSEVCFPSEQPGLQRGQTTDDLSDHYAVFAEIRWKTNAPEVSSILGHRGVRGVLRDGMDC